MTAIQTLNNDWFLIHSRREINLKCSIPSTVFETLIEHNIIEDPFYGLNEHNVKWVYESDWIYELQFDVKDEIFSHNTIILRFNGIDTVAKIELNGEILDNVDNMHKRFDYSVKKKLKKEKNTLRVYFSSPTKEAQRRERIGKAKLSNSMGVVSGVPYIRKAQYSYGWDWGPQLPDIGLWKSVELIASNDFIDFNIYPQFNFHYLIDNKPISDPSELKQTQLPKLKVEKVDIDFQIEMKWIGAKIVNWEEYKYRLVIKDPINSNEIIDILEGKVDNEIFHVKTTLKNPKLWWTHDLGDPFLYLIHFDFIKLNSTLSNNSDKRDDSDKRNGSIIGSLEQKMGIRDIKLIRKKDKWGRSFYFQLNGVPLFARGANWIPVDSFIPRGEKIGLYEINLEAAKAANMNMLRVWGGGIYEQERFYNWCDREGILIWQDFPFACAVYPPDPQFVLNVQEEAIQNIRRIRSHPSLAIWVGNNEIEQFYRVYSLKIFSFSKRRTFKKGYKDMFEKLLPGLIKKLDPQRPYWPSSPSNGIDNKKHGMLGSNSPNYGDSHYWMVWHGGFPFSAYRKFDSRFMSEFGFESFPSLSTLITFATKDDFRFSSPVMENHQKNAAGNKKIMNYMKKRFSIPSNFEQQIILSQLTQAEAIEYGVEHWRRNRNDFHCMGSLYWQLNDCWPVASWASIDYYGRWKALHYFAKRFYSPIFPSAEECKNGFKIWITNDLNYPVKGTIQYELVHISSTGIENIIIQDSIGTTIDACTSKIVVSYQLEKEWIKNDLLNEMLIWYRWIPENYDVNSGSNIDVLLKPNKFNIPDAPQIIETIRLFEAPKDFPLPKPNIVWNVIAKTQTQDSLILEVETDKYALFIYIDCNDIDFVASQNYFSMKPGEKYLIKLTLQPIHNRKINNPAEMLLKLERNLKVKSLYDLIH